MVSKGTRSQLRQSKQITLKRRKKVVLFLFPFLNDPYISYDMLAVDQQDKIKCFPSNITSILEKTRVRFQFEVFTEKLKFIYCSIIETGGTQEQSFFVPRHPFWCFRVTLLSCACYK